jgi:hypothetical protein
LCARLYKYYEIIFQIHYYILNVIADPSIFTRLRSYISFTKKSKLVASVINMYVFTNIVVLLE